MLGIILLFLFAVLVLFISAVLASSAIIIVSCANFIKSFIAPIIIGCIAYILIKKVRKERIE